MQEQTLSTLKQLYAASEYPVCLFDPAFHLLWQNRPVPGIEAGTDWAAFFRQAFGGLLPAGGTHTISCGDIPYSCQFLYNLSEQGVIITIWKEPDSLERLLKHPALRHQLENKLAGLRHHTFGISNAVQTLYHNLEELELDPATEQEQYACLNVIMGNCCRMLKSAAFAGELAKYQEPLKVLPQRIELHRILPEFASHCQTILGRTIRIRCTTEKGIFIQSNPERLTFCLLCLLLCVHAYRAENNAVSIAMEVQHHDVLLHLTAQELGLDAAAPPTFSVFQPLYPEQPLKEELQIIEQFCKTFHSSLIQPHPGDSTPQWTLRIPIAQLWEGQTICQSIRRQMEPGRITPYHILLSDISDYRFY